MDCLIVDIQPAYRKWCHATALKLMAELNTWPEDTGIVGMYVCNKAGLTDDSVDDVRRYWEECGASPALLKRLELIPKGYGFLRQWMDNCVDDEDIINMLRHLRKTHGRSSALVDAAQRNALAPSSQRLFDTTAIWVPADLEPHAGRFQGDWLTMGGGACECLLEIELWLDSVGTKYTRQPQFAY